MAALRGAETIGRPTGSPAHPGPSHPCEGATGRGHENGVRTGLPTRGLV